MPPTVPADTESSVTVATSPAASASITAELSNKEPSAAGGMLPANVPVSVSIAG